MPLCNIATAKGGEAVPVEPDWIDAAEAARLLGVQRSTIKRYEERGKLTPVAVTFEGMRRRPKFRREDVEALRPPTDESETV